MTGPILRNLCRASLSAATAVALMLGWGGRPASAVLTFAVTSTADAVDASPGDGVCATANGQCTLRAAVQEANAFPGVSAITVPAGGYNLAIGGQNEDAAAMGDLDLTGDVSITGAGPAVTAVHGGGLDRVFQVAPGVNASISGVLIESGDAGSNDGGAVQSFGTLTLANVIVQASYADDGAGIDNLGALNIVSSRVSGNVASDVGGGIYNELGASLTLTNSTISSNTAPAVGGGINSFGPMIISGSTINGNVAVSGGGIMSFSNAAITNTTIQGNQTTGFDGGGIDTEGPLTLTNVTFAANSAARDGGGIFKGFAGSATLANTIVASNTSGNDCSGLITSSGHNIDTDGTCGLVATGDMPNTDPLLGPLADNGGPTFTRAPMTSSPAIDLGDALACPSTDQRGVARPLDGDGLAGAACDIGAVEPGRLDADQDGCIDEQEAQTLPASETSGGHRDPNNFWDFFDVPTGPGLMRDRSVSGPDIFAVIGRFNTTGNPAVDPLSPPPSSGYHSAYDRGPLLGPDPWDLGPADGSIASTDIFAIIAQFNHSCA